MKHLNKIQLQDNTKAVSIHAGSNIIIVADHEREGKDLLINVNVPKGNSLLDFSGAGDYLVHGYDNKGELKYRHYAINKEGGFIILTPYKWLHLILMQPTLNE